MKSTVTVTGRMRGMRSASGWATMTAATPAISKRPGQRTAVEPPRRADQADGEGHDQLYLAVVLFEAQVEQLGVGQHVEPAVAFVAQGLGEGEAGHAAAGGVVNMKVPAMLAMGLAGSPSCA